MERGTLFAATGWSLLRSDPPSRWSSAACGGRPGATPRRSPRARRSTRGPRLRPGARRRGRTPLRAHYRPREYGALEQNWAIAQDDRGVVYVGNNAGVLEYDGASWRLITVPNRSVVRSLANDGQGRIYLGAVNDFGYLALGAKGVTEFVSLLQHVPAENRAFGDVWRTLLAPDGIYFQSQQYLFRWADGRLRVWKSHSRFHRAAVAAGTIYLGQPETGLMRLAGDQLVEVPGGRRFTNETRPVVLPYDDDRVLVGTRADGLFLADGKSVARFPTEIDEWLRTTDLYRGAALPDGTIALTHGRRHDDHRSAGRFLHRFDSSSGVDDALYSFFADRQGALWLGMEAASRASRRPRRCRSSTRTPGLTGGGVTFVHRHAGTLYVATSRGVYYLRPRAPRPRRDAAAGERVIRPGRRDQPDRPVLVARIGGRSVRARPVAVARRHRRRRVPDRGRQGGADSRVGGRVVAGRGAASLEEEPGRVFVGLFDGLASLRLDGGKWVFEGRVHGVSDEVRSIVEDIDGRLWLGTPTGGSSNRLRSSAPGGADAGCR